MAETNDFKIWALNVLPIVFDDYLSQKDLFVKLVRYVNGLLGDAVTLYNDYTAMETGTIGDLEDLHTTDKDSIVDAINEVEDDVEALKTDKLDAPTLAGTSGQVLTSDGEGGQVWAAVGSGEIVVDNTLTVSGAAADAKKTGDEITSVKADITEYSNVTFTETSGYFGSDGGINAASESAQEKYTNRLSVRPSDKLKIVIDFPAIVGIWVAYASYTKQNQFISRTVIGNTNGTHFEDTVTVPNGVAYIAFCYRTWGTSTESISYYSSVYEISKNANQATNIIEPSHNLFPGRFSGLGNFEFVNGKLKNTVADTYTDFHFVTQFRSGSTNIDVSTVMEINFVGRIRATVTTSGNGDNITIVHNGLSKNFAAIIPFGFTSGKTYTVSFNVDGYDVQSIGGLVISDIQIEENDTNTPYIPYDSAIDYIARGNIHDAITEKDLNILLMGDSIFGSDGEIALFLDQMCGNCVNGAFGGTQVSIRTDSSDAFKYFDGVNIITALCNQSWTAQDIAASSLASTYPWITARLAGLKAVNMSKVDLLIMDWGTNDYTAGATIETITTAYGTVIDLLQETYPELRILITTPIWRYWGTPQDNENGDTKVYNVSTLKEIALAIEQYAKDKRISVLNAYQNLPLSYNTADTYFDSGDKTHLNAFGNKIYAELLHGKIRSIY